MFFFLAEVNDQIDGNFSFKVRMLIFLSAVALVNPIKKIDLIVHALVFLNWVL